MSMAVYGKHPAKGDFLEHGVPTALKPVLEGWLDSVLAQVRVELATSWTEVWRDAPMLRFWIGEGVWGTPVAGVMAASQDRVGRRFPLMIFCAGDDAALLPAPTIGEDGGWYDGIAAHLLSRLVLTDLAATADLLAGANAPHDLGGPEPGPDSFWAVRPGATIAGLLADVALTDHRRSVAGRSYWWVAGQDAPDPMDEPEPVAEPDLGAKPEPESSVETEAETESPVAPSGAWDLPETALPKDDDSPFASATGLSIFAAPLPADPTTQVALVEAPVAMAPPVPRVLSSQVWAGTGLPSGQVLAWLLRGVTGND